MSDATKNKALGLGINAINDVRKRIDCIIDDKYIFFYQSDLCIEALTGYVNMIH